MVFHLCIHYEFRQLRLMVLIVDAQRVPVVFYAFYYWYKQAAHFQRELEFIPVIISETDLPITRDIL